ncbi:MAG: ClbS/DfsB family four-helix bundle protein [Cyclobacteriaceae bacterium]
MPRPKTKDELIEQSHKGYQKLNDFIDSFSDEEKSKDFPSGTLNRNIRDVIAHLHHWHLMLLEWYKVGMTGEKPHMPATGYKWKDLPALNKEIQKMYTTIDLKKARTLLKQSFESAHKLIQKHSNEELFEKKRYVWTGTTSMGAYFVSAVSSHYEWAYKLIKRVKK